MDKIDIDRPGTPYDIEHKFILVQFVGRLVRRKFEFLAERAKGEIVSRDFRMPSKEKVLTP